MTHDRLLKQGKITRNEYDQLVALKMRSNNPAFTKESRREAKRMYHEKEREYGRRRIAGDSQMIRGMERRP
jgi:membrane peptidoglycan carboxypeptidase